MDLLNTKISPAAGWFIILLVLYGSAIALIFSYGKNNPPANVPTVVQQNNEDEGRIIPYSWETWHPMHPVFHPNLYPNGS